MERTRKKQPPRRRPSLILVLAAAATVLAGLAIIVAVPAGWGQLADLAANDGPEQAATESGGALPRYVLAAPRDVREAYRFAAERPDVMSWIPCYCGCGGHSGHRSARNCFVKEGSTPSDVQFDPHGAGCSMCVSIALTAKSMTEEGRSVRDIRAYIDSQYGSLGPGTDTPLPPG